MKWDLIPRHVSISIERFTKEGSKFIQSGPLMKVMGLLSRVTTREIRMIEEPLMVINFRNVLIRNENNYTSMNFCIPRWINFGKMDWWI